MNKPAPMSDDAIKMIVFGTRYEGVVETTRAIIAARDAMWEAMLAAPQQTCQHEWVSAKNQYVKNGSVCPKCGAIDAREPEELAAPQQEPANVRERWNIEADGDDLLVCFNMHEKGEKCDYVRYKPAAQPVAQPVAWMRKWAYDNEKMSKERNENGRMAWPTKFKLLPVTQGQCLRDDVPLYAAPQQEQQT